MKEIQKKEKKKARNTFYNLSSDLVLVNCTVPPPWFHK